MLCAEKMFENGAQASEKTEQQLQPEMPENEDAGNQQGGAGKRDDGFRGDAAFKDRHKFSGVWWKPELQQQVGETEEGAAQQPEYECRLDLWVKVGRRYSGGIGKTADRFQKLIQRVVLAGDTLRLEPGIRSKNVLSPAVAREAYQTIPGCTKGNRLLTGQ